MELKTLFGSKLFAVLLVLPVFVSGCTILGGGGGTTGGPGVIIKAFEPDISQIDSGDEIRLRFSIQNRGPKEARSVTAELAGLDPAEWGISSEPIISLGNLVGVDPRFNTEGGQVTEEFIVRAPPLPQGQLISFNPRLRIHYGYTTTAIKNINIVNENELRRLEQEGKSLPSGITEVSGGPLTVTITTGNIIRAAGSTIRIVPISIKITNTAGGSLVPNIPPTSGITDNDLVFVTLIPPNGLEIASTASQDCKNIIGGGGPVRLFRGREKTITCQMNIVDIPPSVTTKTIRVRLDYDYMVEATTTINVRGTVFGL